MPGSIYKIHVMYCYSSYHIFEMKHDRQKWLSVLKLGGNSAIANLHLSNSKSKNGAQRALLPAKHTNIDNLGAVSQC